MKQGTALSETVLTGALNDLLQLDIDAVQAYGLVVKQLESKARKEAVRRYAADHKRHIEVLKRLIRAHGGVPLPLSHIPTGPFKLAMQATASFGSDRAVLLVFKNNERQSRDKYRRAAAKKGYPADVAKALRRAAADEERHYRWAEKSLQQLGAGRRTAVGKVAEAVAVVNARTVDAVEETEKPIMIVAEGARRAIRAAADHPVRTAAIAAAVAGATGAAVALRKR
jgi:rubrerythrin